MKSKTVEVAILCDGGMCAIPVPFDPKAVFGRVRAPVTVTINGYTFRSTITRMDGKTFIPLRKSNREAAAVESGDRVKVRIAADPDERVVEAPGNRRRVSGASRKWSTWLPKDYSQGRSFAAKPESRVIETEKKS